MGIAVARPSRVVGRRARRGRARRAARATSSSTPPPRPSPAPARRSSRCCSPRSSRGTRCDRFPTRRSRSPATRSGRSPRCIAAGALPLDDGVRFAARRAELTQAAADAHPGRMAALLGATPEQADDACTAAPDACWVANDNAPGQVVIAGTPDGVDAASARAKELGVKRVTPLNVGGAFHTPLMRDAADALALELAAIALRTAVRAGRLEPRRSGLRRRRRLARPTRRARHRAGALALDDGDARRARRRPRSSRSGTARCSRRSPSGARPT